MSQRNPSRSAKSQRERELFRSLLKRISGDDTAPTDKPFDATNQVNPVTKPTPTVKRPQPWHRKALKHLKKNKATYLTFLLGAILIPCFGSYMRMYREVGELNVNYANVKSVICDIKPLSESASVNKSLADRLAQDLGTVKNQLSGFDAEFNRLFNQVVAIRTYLRNKFKANFD